MRLLVLLCLFCMASVLGAQAPDDLPQPGADRTFLARFHAVRPEEAWRYYAAPSRSASAVVEVVGTLSPEEIRQARIAEFLAWFQADLRAFIRKHLGEPDGTAPFAPGVAGPGPRMVPLGGARF